MVRPIKKGTKHYFKRKRRIALEAEATDIATHCLQDFCKNSAAMDDKNSRRHDIRVCNLAVCPGKAGKSRQSGELKRSHKEGCKRNLLDFEQGKSFVLR